MKEIVRVRLENEMDLILAHKRAMRLSELCGLSLITQTSIATAISEIARCAIEFGKQAELRLDIDLTPQKRFLRATIADSIDFTPRCRDAIKYAERLVSKIDVIHSPKETHIILKHKLSSTIPLTDATLKNFTEYFTLEPPLSPYDEIRRKNLLLQELAEKLQEKENDFTILTDSLPLMMFSANNRGLITYSNKWLVDFLGAAPKELNPVVWKLLVHADEFVLFTKTILDGIGRQGPINGQFRLKELATGNYLWHMISIIPLKNEKSEITRWIGFLVDVNAQQVVGQTLKDNKALKAVQDQLFENQGELQQKIIELNRSNYELEQFAHLASHDLQEPLRKMFFYSDRLKQKYNDKLDEVGLAMITNMTAAAARMKELIKDLLSYSQLQQQTLSFEPVNLNTVFSRIVEELDLTIQEKQATITVGKSDVVDGNPIRLHQLFINLVENALKYSKPGVPPEVRINSAMANGQLTVTVWDNGIGFDEQYKERIFGLFERLHTKDKYPGTGIGLSICKRIAELHNGSITAHAAVNEYAEFRVTIPIKQS